MDEYALGWLAADEAIRLNLLGQDYSQGDTKWDRGWNARLDQQRQSQSHAQLHPPQHRSRPLGAGESPRRGATDAVACAHPAITPRLRRG